MPTNRLVGSKVAEFRPDDGGAVVELHRYMQTAQDTIRPRLAVHEFLKVDGAEVEFMGNSPDNYRFTLNFVGSEWRAQYNNLVARIQKQPKGLLVHPVFGNVRVACQGIDGSAIDVGQAVNAIQVPIAFIGAEVDTRATEGRIPSVNTKASEILDAIANLQTYAAPFTSVAATAAVAALAATSTAFATAALAASDDGTADVSLETQLGTVGDDCAAAVDAIEADPANVAAADAQPAVSQCEIVYALCVEAAQAYEDSKPPLIQYTVASDTDVLTLASLLYGPDAQNRVEEILALNRIPNAYRITSGTVLTLSSPTLV